MSEWSYWVIAAVWILWEAYWIISARGVKRAASKEPLLTRVPVFMGLLLGFVLLLAPWWLGPFFGRRILPDDRLLYAAGVFLLLCGVCLAFWARHTLGTNWSGRVTIKENHELVTRGPYRFVRHPIYTGVLFAFTGTTLALGWMGDLFAIALMLAIFAHKIRLEEKVMDQHFGAKYADYRKQTKTLIPFLI
ncbi:MAG TPA: isoprenylcysteine carboxylmethyltransferase family protein [Gammaproteobacteria bacterium]|jgi:protein-S-isoprenylcysteine O-methyltransferase Ste14|nr:isoprenylcysteine carboxylmethyltransferase family protein [Gammaproteobacteria bacterium]